MTSLKHAFVWMAALIGLTSALAGVAAVTAPAQDRTPPAAAPAGIDPKARALLEEMPAAQQRLKSYSATLEVVSASPQGVPGYAGTLAFKKPGRAHVLTRGTEGETQVVADGRNVYIAYPSDKNRFRKRPLPSPSSGTHLGLSYGVEKGLRRYLLGGPLPASGLPPTAMGPSDQVAGVPVETVTLVRPIDGGELIQTLAIGKHDRLLRRRALIARANGQVERWTAWTATLSDVRANPALPDAMSRFTPPPGAKIIPVARDGRSAR